MSVESKIIPAAPEPSTDAPSASMLTRRHLLMGCALLAVSGVALARSPKRKYAAISNAKFEALLPASFGEWTALPASELIMPPESELANKLYEHIVTKSYRNPEGKVVMFLIAYSSLQIDNVQVHRPEVCYHVSGFNIDKNDAATINLPGYSVPGRVVVATRPLRNETILYWTRVGANYPESWSGQRWSMMAANLEGFYPDGVLVRASVINENDNAVPLLTKFYAEMLTKADPVLKRILFDA